MFIGSRAGAKIYGVNAPDGRAVSADSAGIASRGRPAQTSRTDEWLDLNQWHCHLW